MPITSHCEKEVHFHPKLLNWHLALHIMIILSHWSINIGSFKDVFNLINERDFFLIGIKINAFVCRFESEVTLGHWVSTFKWKTEKHAHEFPSWKGHLLFLSIYIIFNPIFKFSFFSLSLSLLSLSLCLSLSLLFWREFVDIDERKQISSKILLSIKNFLSFLILILLTSFRGLFWEESVL